jgi:hypothetical protein
MRALLLVLFYFLGNPFANAANATQPAFCEPSNFKKFEVQYNAKQKPQNLHVYKIGGLTLAGLAVGHSQVSDVVALAQTFSSAGASENYCTWYLNDGNKDAQKAFVWNYVPRPTGSNYQDMGSIYLKALGDDFDQNNISFLSCALSHGYIAMGCDGMRHRGPSVFAMLLAYAGCSPEHAAQIATEIWGSNGIKLQMRTELARLAADIGAANPELVQRLQLLMNL